MSSQLPICLRYSSPKPLSELYNIDRQLITHILAPVVKLIERFLVDATRLSVNDVDYPIDTVILKLDQYSIFEHRFTQKELEPISVFGSNACGKQSMNCRLMCFKKRFKQKRVYLIRI